MPKFNNAYEVLEHLMNNSRDGQNSMWGLIKNEFERLNAENTELKEKNETLEGAIMELTMILSMMMGGK